MNQESEADILAHDKTIPALRFHESIPNGSRIHVQTQILAKGRWLKLKTLELSFMIVIYYLIQIYQNVKFHEYFPSGWRAMAMNLAKER